MNFDLSGNFSGQYFNKHFIKANTVKIKAQSDQWMLTSDAVRKKRWWIGKLWDWITKPQGRISRVRDAMQSMANRNLSETSSILTPDLSKLKIEELKGRLKKLENVYDNLKGFNEQVICRHNKTWTSKIFFWSRVDEMRKKSPLLFNNLQNEILRLSKEIKGENKPKQCESEKEHQVNKPPENNKPKEYVEENSFSSEFIRRQSLACGNKHANLVRLHDMVKGLDGVRVPLPFGLTEQNVLTFLKKAAPSVFVNWKKLIDNPQNQSVSFFKNQETQEILNNIQKSIEMAFSNPNLITEFTDYKTLINWLAKIEQSNSFLMVRSTGSEDTHIANAGGNVSMNYIEPLAPQVFQAAGKVVASYFSISSLENRANAGDNPFTEPLKLAVTLQELIGEVVGGEKDPLRIPASIVLFTNEPFYVGENRDAQFRVMRISACLGHGEGVVNNQGIASDTILVLQSRVNSDEIYYLYDNQAKPERLVPTCVDSNGKIELKLNSNPEVLIQKPIFDPAIIKRLFDLGISIEKAFARQNKGSLIPVDMELVMKEGVIYPVQARPVNRKIACPTYIDTTQMKEENINEGAKANKVLVAGTSSAMTILQKKDVLIADTLEKAERAFIKGSHKLVIVAQDEPPLSHPVVNFSGLAIPCLFYSDLNSVQKLIFNVAEDKPLLVCLQEGVIYPWDKNSLLTPPIKEGYTTHPASIQVSMEGVKQQPATVRKLAQEVTPLDLQALLVGIRAVKTRDVAAKGLSEHPFLRFAETECNKLKRRVSRLTNIPEEVKVTIDAISQLDGKIKRCLAEFLVAKNEGRTELEILFHAKTLYQLISQKDSGIAQLSLTTLPKVVAAAELAIGHQEGLSSPSVLAKETIVAAETINPKTAHAWLAFLKTLEILNNETPSNILEDQILRFKKLINCLDKMDALSIWINTFFCPLKGEPKDILDNLLKDEISDAFMKQMFKLKNDIHALERDVNLFGNSTTLDVARKRLKEVTRYFEKDFSENFNKCSKTEKLVLVPLMTHLVSLFDTSIKSLKASSDVLPSEKEGYFGSILIDYLSLFDIWATSLFSPDEWIMHDDEGEQVVYNYIERIRECLHKTSGLEPSSDFSVAAAVLGTGVTLGRHLPKTLEDCFTLIHQNLLTITQRLNIRFFTPELLQSLDLPPYFIKAMEQLSTGRYEGRLINFSIKDSSINAHYNIPLRNHSAAVTLNHDVDKGSYSVKIGLYGIQNQGPRWVESWNYLYILERLKLIKIQGTPCLTDEQLIIEIGVDSPRKLSFLLEQVRHLVHYSMLEGSYATDYFENELLVLLPKIITKNNMSENDCTVDINPEGIMDFTKSKNADWDMTLRIPDKFHDILRSIALEKGERSPTNFNVYTTILKKLIRDATERIKLTSDEKIIDKLKLNLTSIAHSIEKLIGQYDQSDSVIELNLSNFIQNYYCSKLLRKPFLKEIVDRMEQKCRSNSIKNAIASARKK